MCVLSQCILSWTTVNVFIFEWIYFLHYPLCLYACLHCHPGVPHRWRMRHLPFFLSSLPPRSATSLKDATSSVLPVFIATQECHIAEGRDIFRSSCLHCHPGVPHHWRTRHLPIFQDLLSSILKWSLWVLIWEWFLYCYLAYTTVLHFCRNLIANISKYEAVVRDIWVGLCVTIVSCYTVKVFASTGI